MDKVKYWIGCDLDATLSFDDDDWSEDIGAPIPAMVARVREWLTEGKDVRIFTARVDPDTNGDILESQIAKIEAWCLEQFDCVLPITCKKDCYMIELWDDRCVHVEKNTGKILG